LFWRGVFRRLCSGGHGKIVKSHIHQDGDKLVHIKNVGNEEAKIVRQFSEAKINETSEEGGVISKGIFN